MIYDNIEQALIKAIKPRVPTDYGVCWPNAEKIKKGDKWLDIDNLFAGDFPITTGDEGENEIRGVLQVLIKVKPNTGGKTPLSTMSEISKHFKAGKSYSYGDVTVVFRGASPGPAFTSGEYYTLPLSISYYARYSRALGESNVTPQTYVTIGSVSSQIGYRSIIEMGSTTSKTLTRLSISYHNNTLYIEDSLYESASSLTLEMGGLTLPLIRSGILFKTEDGAALGLRTYMTNREGHRVPYVLRA